MVEEVAAAGEAPAEEVPEAPAEAAEEAPPPKKRLLKKRLRKTPLPRLAGSKKPLRKRLPEEAAPEAPAEEAAEGSSR